MSAPDCERCRLADRHANAYSPEEYEFLVTHTGQIIGERDSLPIISAVFILRSGIRHFCFMPSPALVHWNTPTFRCPWARPALPAILCHGPEVFTPEGVWLNRSPSMLDEHGHFRRFPHCPMRADGGDPDADLRAREYYVAPQFNPGLPRRAAPDWPYL